MEATTAPHPLDELDELAARLTRIAGSADRTVTDAGMAAARLRQAIRTVDRQVTALEDYLRLD